MNTESEKRLENHEWFFHSKIRMEKPFGMSTRFVEISEVPGFRGFGRFPGEMRAWNFHSLFYRTATKSQEAAIGLCAAMCRCGCRFACRLACFQVDRKGDVRCGGYAAGQL